MSAETDIGMMSSMTRAQTTDSTNCPGMTTLEINACVQAELAKVDKLLNQSRSELV
jgi:hypothetical protein